MSRQPLPRSEKGRALAFDDEKFFVERPGKILRLNKMVAPVLNELHEVDLSERFWLRLLEKHLKSCVNQEPFLQSPIKNPHIPLTSVNSFKPITRSHAVRNLVIYLGQAYLHRCSKREIDQLLTDHTRIITGPRSKSIARRYVGGVLPQWFPLGHLIRPQFEKRWKLNQLAIQYSEIFAGNCLRTLPRIYVEYFSTFLDSIPLYAPAEKSFHYEHLISPFSEFLLSKYQEYGSTIVAHQTGGYMGEIESHPDEVFYETIDELKTYGWKIHQKDSPDYAYRLAEYLREWEKSRKEAAVANLALVILPIINEYTTNTVANFLNELFGTLHEDIRKRTIVRPRPTSKRLDNRSQISRLGLACKIPIVDDGKCSIAKRAAGSTLIIQAWIPSTNFLECLAVDQPVMCLSTNERPSTLVKPFLAWLREVQVLHDNGRSLAEAINRMPDLEKWWQQVMAHQMYHRFKETFCRM